MPRSEPSSRTRPDWKGYVALAWALAFGVLYANTVLESRGPTLRSWLGISSVLRPALGLDHPEPPARPVDSHH
ncbi:MAG: hypothetical protein U0794_21755 [Isosphaeraceae bacterium]